MRGSKDLGSSSSGNQSNSGEGSPSEIHDELHQAASVMCDALGNTKGRGRGAERRIGNESLSVKIARAFFSAATVKSGDDEDILPQEDGPDEKLSVYYLFSELFPDHVNNKEGSEGGCKNGLTRLQVGFFLAAPCHRT